MTMVHDRTEGMGLAMRLALGSLVVSGVVLAIKYVAYALTGSVALRADALESVVSVATAVAAIMTIQFAHSPADDEHPYGHHKAEYLMSVVVGALIVVTALVILNEAYESFLAPREIERAGWGVLVNSIATVVNLLWGWMLIKEGRKQKSSMLEAEGKYLMADVVTSVGVVVGVLLAAVTKIEMLDGILAALVALQVLKSGCGVIKNNASGLLDEAVPAEERAKIEEVITTYSDGVLEVHDLRTRHAGKVIFIDFHMVVNGGMTVQESHNICDRIENALEEQVVGAVVTIHVEPEAERRKG